MAKLYDLARMSTLTQGTGTLTLAGTVPGFLSFSDAGVQNGDIIDYAINDYTTLGSEIGTGTYSNSGTTLTRNVTKSTNGNSALNLSGNAQVFICPRAETLNDVSLFTTGKLSLARGGTNADLSATGGTNQFVKQSSSGAGLTVDVIVSADLTNALATPPPIGGTTPNTGKFTALNNTGALSLASGCLTATILGYLGWQSNIVTYPTSTATLGFAVGANFTGGSGEVTFWNTWYSAVTSFNFYQQTAASSAPLLMSIHPTFVSIPLTTASTSTTTGALTVVGGVGVGGALNIGGGLTAASVQTGTTANAGYDGLLTSKALVNFNSSNTDTAVPISIPSGISRYQVVGARISGASASLTTATMGLFTATGGGGTAIITAASSITVNSTTENTNTNSMSLTVNNSLTTTYTSTTLYVRVATPQGSAATGTFSVLIEPLS